METFVLMHDALSVRFVMIEFEKVAWDPVLRELSQSGCMTKRIVEYFEESRTRKSQNAVEVKVESRTQAPYPVHTYRRSSTTLLPGSPKQYLVKK